VEITHLPSSPLCIIVVDDDPDDLFVFQWLLKMTGIPVELVPFTSSVEAADFFARIAQSRLPCPDDTIIFSDVKMPGLSGFDLLQQIRTYPEFRTTPVFMISGANVPLDRDQSHQLGANGYFQKFPTVPEFIELLRIGSSGHSRHCGLPTNTPFAPRKPVPPNPGPAAPG
jgi:CheY-like chemotaxis protein